MMGRLNRDQGQFFYSFHLEEAVPGDHAVRDIAAVLDLSCEINALQCQGAPKAPIGAALMPGAACLLQP